MQHVQTPDERAQARQQPPPRHAVRQQAMGGGPRQANSTANAIALTFWIALWLLNGASTALPFTLLGQRLGAAGAQLGLWIGAGICVHVIVSLIENHLWRSFPRCRPEEKGALAAEILFVGFLDVFTAALSLFALFTYLGLATPSLTWYAVCTIFAEVIAIGAELMIRLHWRLMRV